LDVLSNFGQLDIHPGDYDLIEVHDGQEIINGYKVHHTPGHTPGHICIGCGPFLFLGDHILSVTTPHQVPKSLWNGGGLEVYLGSLAKAANLGFTFGLPAHEEEIDSVSRRAREIELFHYRRLDELCELCNKEKSLYELTKDYYRQHQELIQNSSIDELGTVDFIMALEEIKAHVENLVENQRIIVHAQLIQYQDIDAADIRPYGISAFMGSTAILLFPSLDHSGYQISDSRAEYPNHPLFKLLAPTHFFFITYPI
jgi:hypothetical protein